MPPLFEVLAFHVIGFCGGFALLELIVPGEGLHNGLALCAGRVRRVASMFRERAKRLIVLYRRGRDDRRLRRLTDERVCSTAERLICTGALQSDRLTGSPIERDDK
jgi:hypothetical protein